MNTLLVPLLVQGAGGLFLVSVCCALYTSRHRAHFLSWTLAWLCFLFWLLLGTIEMEWDSLCPALPHWGPWLRDAAVVCSWWYAALWVTGMLHFAFGRNLGAWILVVLAAAGITGLVAVRALPGPAGGALHAGVLTIVYGWSAVGAARVHRRLRQTGALLFATFLAFYAAEQLQHTAVNASIAVTGDRPPYLSYLSFADFLLETLIAVGMILVLLDEDQAALLAAERRLAKERLREEQAHQSQRIETLATLVGGIAHDFNNQLTVILGNVGLVLAETPPSDHRCRMLADAERAAQRCADMTRKLVTFSRRRARQPASLNLNDLLSEAAQDLPRFLPGHVRVRVERASDLWMIEADATELHQVLKNLAVNAGEAMPQGGTLVLATANEEVGEADLPPHANAQPGKFVVLSVADTGRGMTQEVQARLFEPFFTTKGVGKGPGLGLAVVFGIVRTHGGWVRVTSGPGQGSTFRVFLPAAASAAAPPLPTPAPANKGHSECILVVDDEPGVRALAQTVLEKSGFQVLTARDGEEALAVYRERAATIDLVLTDFAMPGMNGLEVLKALRSLNPDVPVIVSSGYTVAGDSDRLRSAGARAFVAKPFQPHELVRIVREVFDRSHLPSP